MNKCYDLVMWTGSTPCYSCHLCLVAGYRKGHRTLFPLDHGRGSLSLHEYGIDNERHIPGLRSRDPSSPGFVFADAAAKQHGLGGE